MFERYLQKEGFLEIPMSGKRYRINIEGKILAEDNLEVETTFDQEGNLVAWMLLWNNWAYYEVATLIAHTFKPIYVPLLHWNKLKVLFLDGNKKNIHPSNLVWKFPTGLESRQYPGYAFIPGYSRYVISKEGEVMNYVTNKKIRNYINYGGYCVYSLIPDIGKVNTIGRHRALCLAWTDYPVTVDKLHINHINGVPGDDRLENLEWVTPRGNVLHAIKTGLRDDCLNPVITKNILTDEEIKHSSISECARYLGVDESTVRWNINYGNYKLVNGLFLLKDEKDTSPWREVSKKEIEQENKKYTHGTAVLRRNVKTGIIDEFPTIRACSNEMGLSEPAISRRLSKNNQQIYPPGYQFKLKSDPTPWRDVENLKNELDKHKSPKQIKVRNVFTKEEWSFNRLVDATITLGISRDVVVSRINYKTKTPYFQWEFNCDDSEWINWDDKALELFRLAIEEKKPLKGRGFIITHSLTGESKLYTSLRRVLKDFNSSKSMVHYCLHTGKPFCRDWRIEFCLPPDSQASNLEID